MFIKFYCASLLFVIICIHTSPVMAHGMSGDRLTKLNHHIEHNPDDHTLYIKRGRLHLSKERYNKAMADLKKAQALAPTEYEALYWQGMVLSEQNKHQAALSVLMRYLKQKPASSLGLQLAAKNHIALDQAEAAEKLLKKSLSLEKTPAPQLYLDYLQSMERIQPLPLENIRKVITKALNRHQSQVVYIDYIVDLEMKLNHHAEAMAWIAHLPLKLQNTPEWLMTAGDIHSHLKQSKDATQYYRKALAQIQSLPPIKRSLHVYEQLASRATASIQNLSTHQKP